MDTVTSADGTPIAFEGIGGGRPVILVGGALCDRASHRPLAERLASQYTAITYDRRGRGDSGDAAAYAVEREIDDLGALIAAAGGSASVYGHSSGAGLALRAAARGLPITKVALYEPPFSPDDSEARQAAQDYSVELERLLADGRHEDAVELFMTIVGMPQEAIEQAQGEPWWRGLVALAPTLAYDSEVMGDRIRGGTIPTEEVRRVTMPALVLCGGASPDWMIDIGRQVADGMRNGEHGVLEGEDHAVADDVLAPVLTSFLAE